MTGSNARAQGMAALSPVNRRRDSPAPPAPPRRNDRAAVPRSTHLVDLRFAELGSFLAARRAEVTPHQVGLPGGGARRLPGLRREEVAMLAGIGVSWYTWIEQGRARNVSLEVLDAIAGVLSFDEAQRRYVMRLAGYSAPRRPDSPIDDELHHASGIVDSYLPNPAYILDRYWDVVVANSAAAYLLGIGDSQANYLTLLFEQPESAERFPYWRQEAEDAVARFRTMSGEFLGDLRLHSMIGRLRDGSPVFAELWDEHRVSDGSSSTQVLFHPELGEVSLVRVILDLAPNSGTQLILLYPQPTTAEALERCPAYVEGRELARLRAMGIPARSWAG